MKELLDCLKQSKEKNVIVSLSQDHKILIIEMKVWTMRNLEETIAVRLPFDLKQKLDQVARERDRSISYIVRLVLRNALNQR